MSRIDVLPAEKGKFKVCIDFLQVGIAYSSCELANEQAKNIYQKRPYMTLVLFQLKKVK